MKVEAFLADLRRMPPATPEALTGGKPFVVLSPHPDDESLGAGGLIAAACAARQRVEVVLLTDGAGSHRASRRYPPRRLAALRREEAARAAEALGLAADRLSHFDLPDAQAPIEGPGFEDAVARLDGRVEACGADALFVTFGHDPHCDHEAADRMAREVRRRRPALKLWSYPIWAWHLPPEGDIPVEPPRGFRIDITPWQAAKRAAIAAHASQMTDLIDDDPDGFRFTDDTIAPFLGRFEYFFEVPR